MEMGIIDENMKPISLLNLLVRILKVGLFYSVAFGDLIDQPFSQHI